jgi:hypothetical protein
LPPAPRVFLFGPPAWPRLTVPFRLAEGDG